MQGPYSKDRSRKLSTGYFHTSTLTHPTPVRSVSYIDLTRIRWGYSNRDWRDQIRRHANATSEMTGTSTTVQFLRGRTFLRHRWPLNSNSPNSVTEESWGDLGLSQLGPGFNPTDSANSQAYDRALADAYKHIREAQVQVSGPTFLGEARESWRMLTRPLQGLRNLASEFLGVVRKRKKANPRQWKNDLSSAWLEQAFGWNPLIADARDAAKAWNRLFDQERVIPFTGFGVQTTDRGTGTSVSSGIGENYTFLKHTLLQNSSTRIVKIRGAVRASSKSGGRAQLELYGFTPSEFIPTAWELLPWSFLVDYFTNIGDILTAGVTDTSGVIWVSRADVAIYDYVVRSEFDLLKTRDTTLGADDFIYGWGSPSLIRWQRRRVNRTRSFGLTIPDLTFSLPGSDGQLANIAALLGQANMVHPQRPHRIK